MHAFHSPPQHHLFSSFNKHREKTNHTPCTFFAKTGACKFGNKCRYSHEIANKNDSTTDNKRYKRNCLRKLLESIDVFTVVLQYIPTNTIYNVMRVSRQFHALVAESKILHREVSQLLKKHGQVSNVWKNYANEVHWLLNNAPTHITTSILNIWMLKCSDRLTIVNKCLDLIDNPQEALNHMFEQDNHTSEPRVLKQILLHPRINEAQFVEHILATENGHRWSAIEVLKKFVNLKIYGKDFFKFFLERRGSSGEARLMLEFMDVVYNNYECLSLSVAKRSYALAAEILGKIRNKREAMISIGVNVHDLLPDYSFVETFSEYNDITTLIPPDQLFPRYLEYPNIVIAYLKYRNDLHKYVDVNKYFSTLLSSSLLRIAELSFALLKKYRDELDNRHLVLQQCIACAAPRKFVNQVVSYMTDLTLEERYSVIKCSLTTRVNSELYKLILSSPEFDPHQDSELKEILVERFSSFKDEVTYLVSSYLKENKIL